MWGLKGPVGDATLYNELPPELRVQLGDTAMRIRGREGKRVEAMLATANDLLTVKKYLAKGEWLYWIDNVLQIFSIPTAENYIRIAQWCAELEERGTVVNFTNLSVSGLIDLSRKSTSDKIVAQVLEKAKNAPVPHWFIQDLIDEEKEEETNARLRAKKAKREAESVERDKEAAEWLALRSMADNETGDSNWVRARLAKLVLLDAQLCKQLRAHRNIESAFADVSAYVAKQLTPGETQDEAPPPWAPLDVALPDDADELDGTVSEAAE